MKISSLVFCGSLLFCAQAVRAWDLQPYAGTRDPRLRTDDVVYGDQYAAAQPLMMAQNQTFRTGGVRATGAGQSVQVAADYSFASDATALFRPRRWRRPLAVGGVISWLNPRAWRQDPYRTTTVLAGELIVFGIAYVVIECFDDDSSGHGFTPDPGRADSEATGGSRPTGGNGSSAGGGASDGGGTTPPPPPPPPPPEGGGGDETPF